jgi:hypothetical protein
MLMSLTVDMYTKNAPKQSSPVSAVTMEWTDKENCIAVTALHKCGIERARIFELLKPLNIMRFWIWEE